MWDELQGQNVAEMQCSVVWAVVQYVPATELNNDGGGQAVNNRSTSLLLFWFSVPFSLAGKKMRFRVKYSVIRDSIALLRANQFARSPVADFKMNIINNAN